MSDVSSYCFGAAYITGYEGLNEMRTYNRRDWFYALGIFFFVLLLAAGQISAGIPDWGDDHAAYISEGIAIADNSLNEQAEINYFYHPSLLTKESNDGKLIYAWGYPLLQACIYKIAGFNRTNYSFVIWYKIPLVLSLAMLGGVLFLFFRRRFNMFISAFLALLFCLSGDLIESVNKLYSDLPFVFLTFLTFLLMEMYSEQPGSPILSVGYGFALWLTYETRLNGVSVCILALLGHVLSQRKGFISKKRFWKNLIPYAVFAVLILITERLWLAPATQNLSDVGAVSITTVWDNVYYYVFKMISYFSALSGIQIRPLGFIVPVFCVLGFVKNGFGRNLYMSVLMIGSFIVLVLLPYQQGLRYLYNVLPILLMYAAYGVLTVVKWMMKLIGRRKNFHIVGTVAVYSVAIILLLSSGTCQIFRDVRNISDRGKPTETDVYSDYAVEMYDYIQNHTSQDAVVAFAKPRVLYLNTERLSFRPGFNGHELADADYLLFCKLPSGVFSEVSPDEVPTEILKENKWFALYEIIKDVSSECSE